MKKRMGAIFVALLGIFLLSAHTAWSQSTIKYKLKFHTWEGTTSLHWGPSYTAFKKAVEEKSNGRITIDLYPSGALGTMPEGLNMVRTGIADIGFLPDDYSEKEMPLGLACVLPSPYTASEKLSCFQKLYDEYYRELDAKQNVVTIGYWTLAKYGLFTRSKKLSKMADLKGLAIRSNNPITTAAYKKLEAIPMSMPLTEAIQSLEKGILEGVACSPMFLAIYKIHEAGRPGYFHEMGGMPSGFSTFKINKKVLDGMPKDLQKIILDAGALYLAKIYNKTADDADITGIEELKKRGGDLIHFSDVEKTRMQKEILEPLWTDWAKRKDAEGFPGTKLAKIVKANCK